VLGLSEPLTRRTEPSIITVLTPPDWRVLAVMASSLQLRSQFMDLIRQIPDGSHEGFGPWIDRSPWQSSGLGGRPTSSGSRQADRISRIGLGGLFAHRGAGIGVVGRVRPGVNQIDAGGIMMSRGNRRMTLDFTQGRIEAFSAAHGGGVFVRKDARGYSLFHEETGEPLARLRPTGAKDMVEVLCWGYRERWEPIGDFGGILMPLDEALVYIAEDPMGCFWH
jgi:hypothetical protein